MSRNTGNFIPRNNALGSRLQPLLSSINTTNRKKPPTRSLPALHTIGEDGVDHINIWDQGKTDLGRLLAHGTSLTFRHSIFNKFSTMEGFWNYIRSAERDDRLRKLVGKPLRNCIRTLTFQQVPNFKAIIMDANWQKIQQYPALREAVKESTLRFDCYFKYRRQDGVPERPQFSFWLLEGFNEIRNALKEDREPNFDFLKDRKNMGIYDAVIPKKEIEAEAEEKQSENNQDVLTQTDKNDLALLLRTRVEEEHPGEGLVEGIQQESIIADPVEVQEEVFQSVQEEVSQ